MREVPLIEHPNQLHLPVAARVAEGERKRQARDQASWQEAQTRDDLSGYQAYLAACSVNGCGYQGQAAARVAALASELELRRTAQGFKDNGDGTVTDKKTGLQWMRCALGQTWRNGTCD